MNNSKITPQTTLLKLMDNKKFQKILLKYKVPCLVCPFAAFEMQNLTLKEICQTDDIDLEKLLKDLNKVNKTKPLK